MDLGNNYNYQYASRCFGGSLKVVASFKMRGKISQRSSVNRKLKLFLFSFFLAAQHNMWDYNSSTSDQTHILCNGSMQS